MEILAVTSTAQRDSLWGELSSDMISWAFDRRANGHIIPAVKTIVMQEQQENLMSKRIQDLTNKLLVSEKTVRQLKERKHSRKHSIAHAANHRQQHHIQATHSDSGTTDT